MKNCGRRFHNEVGKYRFLNELIKVVSPKVSHVHTELAYTTDTNETQADWMSCPPPPLLSSTWGRLHRRKWRWRLWRCCTVGRSHFPMNLRSVKRTRRWGGRVWISFSSFHQTELINHPPFNTIALIRSSFSSSGLVTCDPELPLDRTLIPSPPTRPKHPVFDNEDMGKVRTPTPWCWDLIRLLRKST